VYLTPRHREALAHLQYGLSGQRGIVVLTGEAGTGKTTLIRAALAAERGRSTPCAFVTNPTLTRAEFFELLAVEFGFSRAVAASKAQFLVELRQLIAGRHVAGAPAALVIDEAQSLSHELLEEIRLLTNLETDDEKLLPVILAGQPELSDRLNETGLRQLKQRIVLRCALAPLDLHETAAYIAGRIRIAGGDPVRLYTRDAVALIHECSRGIPRVISVICDNALISGFAQEIRPIDRRVIEEVLRDFDLDGAAQPQLPPSAPSATSAQSATLATEAPEAQPFDSTRSGPADVMLAAAAVDVAREEPPRGDDAVRAFRPRRRFSFFSG